MNNNQKISKLEFFEKIKTIPFIHLISEFNIYSDDRIKNIIHLKECFDGFYNNETLINETKNNQVIDFNKVRGTANNKSIELNYPKDNSWIKTLFHYLTIADPIPLKGELSRVQYNVDVKLRKDPLYYYSIDSNTNDMEFVTFDNGETFYIKNGNHRGCIAKILYILEEHATGCSNHLLSGVTLEYRTINRASK